MPVTYRFTGTGCPVTISGNVVTFAAWDLHWKWCDDNYAAGYVYNLTRSASSAVQSRSGSESAGYALTVADASGWATGDLCVLCPASSLTTSATQAALVTAATALDVAIQAYATATYSPRFESGWLLGTKPISIYGHLSGARCEISAATCVQINGDVGAVTTQVVWQNLTVRDGTNGFQINDTSAGETGGGALMWGCRSISCTNGYYFYDGKDNAFVTAFCSAVGGLASVGFRFDTAAGTAYHCHADRCLIGFHNGNLVGVFQNCVATRCSTGCYFSLTNGTFTKCASSDTTGSEAGLRSLTMAQIARWDEGNNRGFFGDDLRILMTSSLFDAGTYSASYTVDIDGNAITNGHAPIGIHVGTTNAYGVTWPVAAQTESGVSFVNFTGTVTGTADASSQSSASEASVSESSASESSASEASVSVSSASCASQSSGSESSGSESSFSELSESSVAGNQSASSLSYSSLSESTASTESTSSASSVSSSDSSLSASISSSTSSESGETDAVNTWEQFIRSNGSYAQISIQQPTRTKSETGATIQTWATTQTLYADIQDSSPRTRARYSNREMAVDKSIYVATDPACDQGWRVLYGSEYWRIAGVEELEKTRLWRLDVEKVL